MDEYTQYPANLTQASVVESNYIFALSLFRVHSTVDFLIGGQVDVLSDYKETVAENNLKFLNNNCNDITDRLINFLLNHVHPVLLKCK